MDEVLNNIKEEGILREISKKQSRFRKIWLLLLTVFLILLVVSLSFYTFVNGDILISIFTSYTLEKDNTIQFKDNLIIFSGDTYEELKNYFVTHQRNEFKACLLGNIEHNKYIINSLVYPEIYSSSWSHVQSEGCPQEIIIDLHSHPTRRCIFSQQDIKSYKEQKKNNPNLIMGLMCDVKRFNFYQL